MNIKNLKLMIFMLILLTFPTFINADACSDAKKDAASVKASYEFMYRKGVPTFKITVSNMTKNIALIDTDGKENRSGVMYTEAMLSSYSVDILVYDYNYTCTNPVRTIILKLPQYNQYSDMDICSDIKDYKYCKRIITEDIKVSDIYDKLVAYKTALNKSNNKQETTPEDIEEEFILNENAPIYETNKKPKEEVLKAKEEVKNEINKSEEEINKVTIILSIVVLTLLIVGVVLFIIYKRMKKRMVV